MDIDYSQYGYIYRSTNRINGKSYVGLHRIKPNEVWFDYLGSGIAIKRAVRKYGRESFEKDLITYSSKESIAELETLYINRELLLNPNGIYNVLKAGSERLSYRTTEELNSYPILDWYFDLKMTTTEIADKLEFSQQVIHGYIMLFKNDPRFEKFRPHFGVSDRPMKPQKRVECFNCGKLYARQNISKHEEFCTRAKQPKPSIPDTFEFCEFCYESKLTKRMTLHKKFCKMNPAVEAKQCEYCGAHVKNYRAKWCGDHKYKSQRI